ncbi:hypothetical protein [Corallococcus sp. M7]
MEALVAVVTAQSQGVALEDEHPLHLHLFEAVPARLALADAHVGEHLHPVHCLRVRGDERLGRDVDEVRAESGALLILQRPHRRRVDHRKVHEDMGEALGQAVPEDATGQAVMSLPCLSTSSTRTRSGSGADSPRRTGLAKGFAARLRAVLPKTFRRTARWRRSLYATSSSAWYCGR